MKPEMILCCAILSGLIGFGAYCVSCTVHVWKTRNARSSADRPLYVSRSRRLARWSIVILGLGLLCIALAVISRVTVEREGLLTAEGLFTLRGREGFEVDYLTQEKVLSANALLAQFHSPEREAQIAVLKNRREAHEVEERIIAHRPLAPDPEITRRQLELNTEQRHLRSLLDQLIPARDLVARELTRGRVTREERIIKLDGELDNLHSELEQAVTRRRLCQEQLARTDALHRRRVISEIEYITQCREVEVLGTEVVKLQNRLKNVEREKTEIQKSYPILEDLALTQVNALDQEIAQAQERRTPIRTEEQTVKVQLAADLSRAERQKQEQLQEIEYQIQQCDAQLSGLEHTLTIKAPFGGHLVYRNPSPSTALTDNPLLVLAPAKGLRLRIRLASLEANALEKAGPVILEMVWQDVQRRFLGYLIGRCELNHDPGFVMGELACNPPAEAVRDLASNKTVKARLLWSPPLYNHPLFNLGVALSAIGFVGWLGARLRFRRGRLPREIVEQPGLEIENGKVNGDLVGIQLTSKTSTDTERGIVGGRWSRSPSEVNSDDDALHLEWTP